MFDETLVSVFGEDGNIPDEEDLFCLAKKTNSNILKPRIYMGVSTEDFLYEDNVKLREHFKKLDCDYIYRKSQGVHNWAFWDEYIQYVLEWMFAE